MKKIFLILITLLVISKISFSQVIEFQYAKCINGIWGEWEKAYSYAIKGKYDDFILYDKYRHPSEYIMRVKIYYYSEEKKAKKLRLKNGWYEYSGVVEYYTTDYNSQYLNFNFERWPHGCLTAKGTDITPIIDKKYVKVNQREAKINIQAYKGKDPRCYNIYFDNIGIGIIIK